MLHINKFITITIMAVGLSSCTHVISETSIFQSKQENRRGIAESLVLDNENYLPETVILRHDRVETSIGTIAVTIATTGSDRLIVHCGGNMTDRKTDGVNYLSGLLSFGDVLLFDYPGYGDSEGAATIPDFEVAQKAIAEEVNGLDYQNLVVWGQSLGGFICGQMVNSITDLDYVVFETTAANASDIAKVWTPWYLKPVVRVEIQGGLENYDSASALRGFQGRVLVLGAEDDEQLPVELSQKLAADIKEVGADVTYIEFAGARHMDVPKQPEFNTKISSFFEK